MIFSKSNSLRVYLQASMYLKSLMLLCLLFFIIDVSAQGDDQTNKQIIKIGIYHNPPLQDYKDGKASGLYPEIIKELSKKYHWKIEYVNGSWDEVYNDLLKGKIDLLTNIIYLPERDSLVSFNKETILNMWGELFLIDNSKIQHIVDLKNKKIGVLKAGANGKAFKVLASKFEVPINYFDYPDYESIANALEKRQIDGGVINNFVGNQLLNKYFIKKSNIVFAPNRLLFATKKGKNIELLSKIDQTLKIWKADKNSFYYKQIGVWIAEVPESSFNYKYLIITIIGFISILVVSFLWVYLLRKQVKKVLKKNEKNQHKLLLSQKSAGIAFLVWDLKTDLIEVNEEINRLFGLNETSKTLPGALIKNMVHPDDANKVDQALKKAISGRETYNIEHRNIRSDGSVFWVHAIADLSYDDMGNPAELIGTVIDITDIKQAAAELLDNRERLEHAEQVAQLGNYVLDLSNNTITLSSGAQKITGFKANKITLAVFEKSILKLDQIKYETALNNLIHRGVTFQIEVRFNHLKSNQIINLTNFGIYDKKAHKIYVVIQDNTEKHNLERQFIQAFIEAQEVEKQEIGEDLHDGISQILLAESMYIDVLLATNKEFKKQTLQQIKKIKELNLSAINQARNMAQGLMSKQLKEDGLIKSLENITIDNNNSKKVSFIFETEGLEESDIAPEVKTHIFRIAQEITTNIIKHSLATRAIISLTQTKNHLIKLSVKDNGVGIDYDKMKRENKGTGLKNIERRVTLLNGTLHIDTAPNKGTTFTIESPMT